jgi:MFS family permease
VIITLENFLCSMSFFLLMIVVAKFATDQFDASPALAGLSAGIFVIGAIIARPLCGRWIHRLGQTKMLLVGVLLGLVMTVLYFAVTGVASLLLIRFLHGTAFCTTTVATGTIVAGVVPSERYGEGIGYFSLSGTVANAIGPFLGLLLIQHGSFTSIIIACSIASAIGLLILPLLSVRDVELTDEQLKETKDFRFTNLVDLKVIPVALTVMVTYVCYVSVVSFLALYSEEIQLTGAAGVFFLVVGVIVFLTRPFVGRRFDTKGENSVMYPGIPIFVLGLVVLSQARHGYVLVLAAAIIGLGLGAIQSSGPAIVAKITPSHRMGLGISTYYMFADMGTGFGPLVCGLLIPLTGYRGMYGVMAAVAAGGLALYYALYGRHVGVAVNR